MAKPTSHSCLLNTMMFGFWMTFTLLSHSVLQIWQCHATPLLFLLTEEHLHGRSTSLEPCWKKGCAPPLLAPVTMFISLAPRRTGKPHPLRTQRRKPPLIPKRYYSSKSQLIHLIFCVFYLCVCTGAWSKAGKWVSKSFINQAVTF